MRLALVVLALGGARALKLSRRRLAEAAIGGAWLARAQHAGAATGGVVSDEVPVQFAAEALGLQLDALGYARTTLGAIPARRCAVAAVQPGSAADKAGVAADWTVVSVAGEPVERLGPRDVADRIAAAPRPVTVVFRDPERFAAALEPGSGARAASTTVLPPTGPYLEPQVLAVERLATPATCSLGAERGDLLEVRYEGRLRETGALFDGSAITLADGNAVPGRGGDSSIYFVLGMQPAGQFPPAWDAAMAGCCVGEVRRLSVPPVLGFGDKGSPKRQVPPFAALDYTIQLLSVNSNAQPR